MKIAWSIPRIYILVRHVALFVLQEKKIRMIEKNTRAWRRLNNRQYFVYDRFTRTNTKSTYSTMTCIPLTEGDETEREEEEKEYAIDFFDASRIIMNQ